MKANENIFCYAGDTRIPVSEALESFETAIQSDELTSENLEYKNLGELDAVELKFQHLGKELKALIGITVIGRPISGNEMDGKRILYGYKGFSCERVVCNGSLSINNIPVSISKELKGEIDDMFYNTDIKESFSGETWY